MPQEGRGEPHPAWEGGRFSNWPWPTSPWDSFLLLFLCELPASPMVGGLSLASLALWRLWTCPGYSTHTSNPDLTPGVLSLALAAGPWSFSGAFSHTLKADVISHPLPFRQLGLSGSEVLPAGQSKPRQKSSYLSLSTERSFYSDSMVWGDGKGAVEASGLAWLRKGTITLITGVSVGFF